jgi:hypothetical protein
MTVERPASVKAAVWLTLGLVALSAVTSLLAIVFKTELRDAWESGRLDAGSVKPPAIVPVTVVMLIVVALLAVVLMEFFRARHGWARNALTATVVLMALGTLGMIRIGPPALFVVLSAAALVLQVAIVVALWHRDTSAFLRDQPVPGDVPAGS